LKKWMPISRDGSCSAAAMSSMRRLEVLVAISASGLARRLDVAEQRLLRGEVFEDGFDDEVGPRTPAPVTSGIRRSRAARAARRSRGICGKKARVARCMAGAMRSAPLSCSVTWMPRRAHQAAMSPPMTPAPITCTRRMTGNPAPSPLPNARRRSRR
jgi:hypothetical protein